MHHHVRVRFFSTIELVNLRESVKVSSKHRQIANSLAQADLVIVDQLSELPVSRAGSALLFDLLSRHCERTSVVITTTLSLSKWASVFGDPKMTAALLDRFNHLCHIVETGNDGDRFKNRSIHPGRERRPKRSEPS
jgi:DNA replication protein DnaC